MANSPWLDQEWLAEVLMAWGYDYFGWAALAIGTALCEAATIAILLRVLLNVWPPVYAMTATVLSSALWFPHVLARPYILTIPILMMWVAALVRARCENRAPSLWFALLIAIWANMHGSFMFGIGIAALLAAEAVLFAPDWHGRVSQTRQWGIFGALAIGAALITPNGLNGLLFPFHLVNMTTLAYIGEWQGVNFSSPSARLMMVWLLLVLFAALSRGWRLPVIRVGMVLFLLMMALKHVRYMELLGVVSPLLLAPSLALQFARHGTTNLDRLMAELAKPANWRGIVIAGMAMFIITITSLRGEILSPPENMAPAAALAEVKLQHVEGPVFNAYQFGGYLIFSDIPPFIDGRAELYGDAFIQRYVDVVWMNDDVLPLLNEHGITWTLFPPKSPVAILLDHLPGWRRLYTDSAAVVHVRQPS
jgi:hypothetical protein